MSYQPELRKEACRERVAENNNMLQGETAPQSMDVDETFWVEDLEPVMPTSEKRVRQPVCSSLMSLTYLPVSEHLY
jgi:hypothetical protein